MTTEPGVALERSARRKAEVSFRFLGHALAGLLLLLLVIATFAWAGEEVRWTFFTSVHVNRICGDGESGECVTRIPGQIAAANGRHIYVSYDDRRRVQALDLNSGQVPPVDSRVTLEEWHGRVVSLTTARGARLRTHEWPARSHDAGFLALGLVGLVALLGGLAWMIALVNRDDKAIEPPLA